MTRKRMRSELDKADTELVVFRKFVRAAGLPVDPNSIEKRFPPEPDILCSHLNNGPLAFELVEICDPQLAAISASPEGGVSFRWTSDPSPIILRKKLQKKYNTQHPIELLCYTAGRVVTPDDVILPTIRPLLESFRHVFRRAWLLGEEEAQMIWGAS